MFLTVLIFFFGIPQELIGILFPLVVHICQLFLLNSCFLFALKIHFLRVLVDDVGVASRAASRQAAAAVRLSSRTRRPPGQPSSSIWPACCARDAPVPRPARRDGLDGDR